MKMMAIYTILFLAVLAVVILFVGGVLNSIQSTMDGFDWQEESYTVEEGDSLWTISYDYCPEGVDRREWVDEVQALNNMSSCTIYPGQHITVLAPAEGGAL